MIELFKPIEDFENYEISNYGRVYSKKTNKMLKHGISPNGYCQVILCKDGKTYNKRIHRLVAEAFLPNPLCLPCVNHRDENPKNNFVWINEDGSVNFEKSNLEWCTQKYNVNYGTGMQRMAAKNRGRKLSEEAKQKMSESKKGKKQSKETIEKRVLKLRGKKRTEDQRARISESKKGKPNPSVIELNKRLFSKPVILIKDGVVYEFPSMREAERQVGINHRYISMCCFGKQKTCSGYRCYYKSDWEEMQKATPVKKELPYQLSLQFD